MVIELRHAVEVTEKKRVDVQPASMINCSSFLKIPTYADSKNKGTREYVEIEITRTRCSSLYESRYIRCITKR